MKETIHFTSEQMQRVKKTYEDWWDKKGDRLVTGGIVKRYEPLLPRPKYPVLSQYNVHENFSAEDVVDSIEYELSKNEYLGDAFPYFNMDCFGPGVVAAFLGCELKNNDGKTSVWFHPQKKYDITSDGFYYDGDNPVLKRIKAIYAAANKRFEGKVIFGMPDLGGIADILSSFYPGEELLYLLYDEPQAVKKRLGELEVLWQKYYDELRADIGSDKYGFTDWSGILSQKSSYVIQSDFTYMIGNHMFVEFIKEGVQNQTKKLQRTLFHLDGVGELAHLDTLLDIPSLSAVQWVPGTGQPLCDAWPQVFQKILDKDKLCQITGLDCPRLYNLCNELKKAGYNVGRLQHQPLTYELKDREFALTWLEKCKSL